jgi:hypothetical protein
MRAASNAFSVPGVFSVRSMLHETLLDALRAESNSFSVRSVLHQTKP